MNAPEVCYVDYCDRRAVASLTREDLPGPLPLCATHTEDFRMNGARWKITWERSSAAPTSVLAAEPLPVGRSGDRPGAAPVAARAAGPGIGSRLTWWRRSRP